jgi:hypothetical protein
VSATVINPSIRRKFANLTKFGFTFTLINIFLRFLELPTDNDARAFSSSWLTATKRFLEIGAGDSE